MNSHFRYLSRLVESRVAHLLAYMPVVVITGARQTGKSTLVMKAPSLMGRTYYTLDDLDVLDRVRKNPMSLVSSEVGVTFDEVQRAPDILLAIKRSVDHERTPGRFLLTGSANLLLMRQVSESLAGRAIYLHLWPLTESEKIGRPWSGLWTELLAARSLSEAQKRLPKEGVAWENWPERVLRGGFPSLQGLSSAAARAAWFDGYLRTYLERDLSDIASIAALPDYRRLMKLAAARVGQLVNQSALARDAGLPQPTAHRYLNLLETTFQMIRVPSFTPSRTTRLVKSPKLYWCDPGLAAHIAGHGDAMALATSNIAGGFLENLVLLQLLAWRETHPERSEILFWRTRSGEEVDFVLEAGRRLLPIEVKASPHVGLGDARGIERFLDEYPKGAPFGLVLYSGIEVIPLTPRVLALPLSVAFESP